MNFCIAGRCEGASSTSTASAGHGVCEAVQQEFRLDRIGRHRRRRQHAAFWRRARLVSRQHLDQCGQRRLYGGDDAGAGRRHRGGIGIVGDLEQRRRAVENRRVAFDMEGEDRRADDDNEVMRAQRFR